MLTPEQTTAALGVLHEAGLLVDSIEFDGQLHRVPVLDKPRGKDGSYIAHEDDPASLWWQNWRSGESGTWTAKQESSWTAAERKAFARQKEASKKLREAEQTRVHAEAAKKAQAIYYAAADCTGHPYLTAKGVKPVKDLSLTTAPVTIGGASFPKGSLLVPGWSEETTLISLQYINTLGEKRFLPGSKKLGAYCPIGKFPSAMAGDFTTPVLVAEGLATALSLYECLGYPVLVAFDAGNLLPVAEMARRRYPAREIILAADNDVNTEGNPGLTKATAAALAVGGSLAVPRREGQAVDWNDLHSKMGAGEVSLQFMMHKKPEAPAKEEKCKEKLPPGFSLRTGGILPGLWHTEQRENADPVETWIGPPLSVLGETRDENSNAWGLFLEWHDPDGRRHTWAMPKSMLVGKDNSAWLGRLADEGWSGAPGNHARKLLARYLSTCRTQRRALCVPSTGWHHGVFVLPDEVLEPPGAQDNERLVLQTQHPRNPFRMGGEEEGWRSTIGEWSRGNSRLMLAVCASMQGHLIL